MKGIYEDHSVVDILQKYFNKNLEWSVIKLNRDVVIYRHQSSNFVFYLSLELKSKSGISFKNHVKGKPINPRQCEYIGYTFKIVDILTNRILFVSHSCKSLNDCLAASNEFLTNYLKSLMVLL